MLDTTINGNANSSWGGMTNLKYKIGKFVPKFIIEKQIMASEMKRGRQNCLTGTLQ